MCMPGAKGHQKALVSQKTGVMDSFVYHIGAGDKLQQEHVLLTAASLPHGSFKVFSFQVGTVPSHGVKLLPTNLTFFFFKNLLLYVNLLLKYISEGDKSHASVSN